MLILETKENDPGRYKNRGGNLLKEEKERKAIASKLPKILEEITELVNNYEQMTNRKFLVFGRSVLEVISEDYDKRRELKEGQMSARKEVKGVTPSYRNTTTRTPMSVSKIANGQTIGPMSSSVKRVASRTNV